MLSQDEKMIAECGVELSASDLRAMFALKYGDPLNTGWGPRMRWEAGYFTPDDYYEAVVAKLVEDGCAWLDVGSGRDIFPSNQKLAEMLAERCRLLVGVDPDDTLDENRFVHRRVKCSIEDFQSDQKFDVVTMRMVAEHVADPERTIASLARLVKPHGKVIIYTIYRWSPVPILTWLVPFSLHHPAKRLLWGTERKDTFPVEYKMNTRDELFRLFRSGFKERFFIYLDDCRAFARFRAGLFAELLIYRMLRALKLGYPEKCLLGVYERV